MIPEFGLPEPEEHEVEIEKPRPIERTPLQYPSRNEDGRSWEEYFREYGNKRRAALAAAQDAEGEQAEAPEILEWSTEMADPATELPPRSTAAQIHKRLVGQGWDVRVSRSRARIPAVLYASGSDEGSAAEYAAGDVRFPEYVLENIVLVAVKRAGGKVLAVEAAWTNKGGFTGATTLDPYLGREWRPGYLKGRKPNAIELEDGIAPPIGLKEWLDIIAPTKASIAAAQKRKEKEAEQAKELEGMWVG